MIFRYRRSIVSISLAVGLALAVPHGHSEASSPVPQGRGALEPQQDDRLPNGKSQKEEILKAEYQQNVKDAAELTQLAQELQQEIEKSGYSVVSMATLKKTDDIEKLAKKIRARLRHN